MQEEKENNNENPKAIRLVEFLTRIALLRTKLIRDLGDYSHVFWIDDIPKQKGCYTRAWGPNEDFDADVWVEVQNQREPELPRVPTICDDWIDRSTLRIKSDLPKLLTEITRQVENPAGQDGNDQPEFVTYLDSLEDHPEVQTAWDRYVEERWLSWAEKHTEWEAAHKAYSALFAIHQEQLRLGEEYELVVGLGLLCWQTPSGQRTRRHLLVANALLEFESRLGKFTVRPMPDGTSLRPELDMLDIEDQPARAEEAAKALLVGAADDPWDTDCIEGVLRGLVHSISSHGEFEYSLKPTKSAGWEKPVVEYAPALILRKRSTRGLTETLKRIKERIELGEKVPSEFLDLAEIDARSCEQGDAVQCSSIATDDTHVYFPKPSNDEQRRIVDVLRASNGVLVQGPPGTGKSHTIANLICHLLATGQRTLVTAKTPRALQVLQQLIPEELRPLCINLLGSGLDEKRSLEASVGGVLRKQERWIENWAADERAKLREALQRRREEKAVIDRRLRGIRESETHSHSIGEGAYRGTAARIAEAVNRDRHRFEWLAHSAQMDETCPVSTEQLRHLLSQLREYTPNKRQELGCSLPSGVPSVEEFTRLVEDERKAIGEETRVASGADAQFAERLCQQVAADIEFIHASFTAFRETRRQQSASSFSWMQDAVREAVGGHVETWRELLKITDEAISTIGPGAARADEMKLSIKLGDGDVVSGVNEIDARLLHDDACRLKKHLEDGGSLGWWVFRPPVVKERQYLFQKVRVNGKFCNDVEQLSQLVDLLRLHLACEKVWEYWAGRFDKPQGPYAIQFRTLQSLRAALDNALSLEGHIETCREALRTNPDFPEPNWPDEAQIQRIIASCQFAATKSARQRAETAVCAIEGPIAAIAAREDVHTTTRDLLRAVQARDVLGFASAREDLRRLEEERERLQQVDDELKRLHCQMRGFAEEFVESCNEPHWDARVEEIQDAWRWDQARYWIEEYIRKDDAPSLVQRARQVDEDVSGIIAQLASLHAWSYCFSRLTEAHRRHMEAWQQSMRKLGKGTGKHAPRHRREAQQHLNQCREAVPAWVMPLHRVWDTVDPSAGMFDVIIVDEASQCGVESLPLLYLGKKILIVGDDKQISPDAVGVPLDAVHRLMEEFLYDFQFKTLFGVESSLFDHGKLRYGTRRITLREHFRCMPEIIRFSNNLCYADTPLVPLRQYRPDRLEPLMHKFVEGGYREGSGNRVVNRPEAEQIAAKIVELCRDTKYANMTMGVVVLQGEAQANLITDLLLEQLGIDEMLRRRLVCGNSYSFQGDERDIMFLSMVAAPNERIGPLTKSADERRFNVAASRARDQLWLFHSVRIEDLSASCLRRQLLEFFVDNKPTQIGGIDREDLERRAQYDNRGIIQPPDPFDSWFEVDVALALSRRGFNVIPQYEVAGKRIDLVVEGGQARLAVECDGDKWHGAEHYEADMQRQRMLERCGWVFCRIRESAFYSNRHESLQQLWPLLEERGIRAKRNDITHDVTGHEPYTDADHLCAELAQGTVL